MVKLPDSINWRHSTVNSRVLLPRVLAWDIPFFAINALVTYHKSTDVTSQPFESLKSLVSTIFYSILGLAAFEKYVALQLDESILSQFSEHFVDFPHQKST